MEQSPLPDGSPFSNRGAVSPKVKIAMGWDISNASLKPRVFCLEHAIEIEELLSSSGGANVLVICHSGKYMLWFMHYNLCSKKSNRFLLYTDRGVTIHTPKF